MILLRQGSTMAKDVYLYIVQVVVFAFAAILAVNAFKQGDHWAATMLWGIVFGWLVEFTNINSPGCIYHYSPENHDFKVLGVPAWIPVGWGCILYASSWTAQRLAVPWPLRPLAAVFLALNIDLTLDPVANMQRWWVWNETKVNFCLVPFDNFLGWAAIVGIYTLFARASLRLLDQRYGEDVRPYGTNWILPGLAAAVSYALYAFVIKGLVSKIVNGPSIVQPDGLFAAVVYAGIAVVTPVVTWTWAFRARRDRELNLPVLVLPVLFHFLCLAIVLLTHRFGEASMLLIIIPANLMAGFFAYAWPSLEDILCRWGTEYDDDRHSVRPPRVVGAE
jgi:uncharacterized membrane protein